jgi:hypothetical protein
MLWALGVLSVIACTTLENEKNRAKARWAALVMRLLKEMEEAMPQNVKSAVSASRTLGMVICLDFAMLH